MTLTYRVDNFSHEKREYESNGVKFIHLGTIKIKNRVFVVYQSLQALTFHNEVYIEELMQEMSGDVLLNPKLARIEDDSLWEGLILIAKKEGIIK